MYKFISTQAVSISIGSIGIGSDTTDIGIGTNWYPYPKVREKMTIYWIE